MEKYFAGYNNGKPCVYYDDGMGFIHIKHKDRKSIQAAHALARAWNASGEYNRKRKKPPIQLSTEGLTHKKSEPEKD